MRVYLALIIIFQLLISYTVSGAPDQLFLEDSFIFEFNSAAKSQESIKAASQKSNILTVVLFYAHWCPHCQRFAPTYRTYSSKIASKTDTVEFFAVDCALQAAACSAYSIGRYPTLLAFNESFQKPTGITIPNLAVHNETEFYSWIAKNSPFPEDIRQIITPSSSEEPEGLPTEATTTGAGQSATEAAQQQSGGAQQPSTAGWQPATISPLEKYAFSNGMLGVPVKLNRWSRDVGGFVYADSPYSFPQPVDRLHDAIVTIDYIHRNMIPAVAQPDGTLSTQVASDATIFFYVTHLNLPVGSIRSAIFKRFTAFLEFLDQRRSFSTSEWLAVLDVTPLIPLSPKYSLTDTNRYVHCVDTYTGGYTCGLWQLFHILTATASGSGETSSPVMVQEAIHSTVRSFFLCSTCRAHFMGMYDLKAFNRTDSMIEYDSSEDPELYVEAKSLVTLLDHSSTGGEDINVGRLVLKQLDKLKQAYYKSTATITTGDSVSARLQSERNRVMLWLWRAHNAVSVRLASNPNHSINMTPPDTWRAGNKYIKFIKYLDLDVRWPPKDICNICVENEKNMQILTSSQVLLHAKPVEPSGYDFVEDDEESARKSASLDASFGSSKGFDEKYIADFLELTYNYPVDVIPVDSIFDRYFVNQDAENRLRKDGYGFEIPMVLWAVVGVLVFAFFMFLIRNHNKRDAFKYTPATTSHTARGNVPQAKNCAVSDNIQNGGDLELENV